MLAIIYAFIIGVAMKTRSEPVKVGVKLLPSGDIEWMKASRTVSVKEALGFIEGLARQVLLGTAGIPAGNKGPVPFGLTAAGYKALGKHTPAALLQRYIGYGKKGVWYSTILGQVMQRSSSQNKPADTKPSTKKQRVTASKSTAAPKAVTPAAARAEIKRRTDNRKDGKGRKARNPSAFKMAGDALSAIASK